MVDRAGSGHCAATAAARGSRGWAAGPQGAPKPVQGPPPAKGDQKKPGPAPGKGAVAPKAGEAATQVAPAGRKPHRPNSPRGLDEDEIQDETI